MSLLKPLVRIDHDTHTYTTKQEQIFTSVTRLIGSFKDPFMERQMAENTAKKRARMVEEEHAKTGRSKLSIIATYPKYARGITTEAVLKEWEMKREEASLEGTNVHNIVENYIKTGIVEPGYEDYCTLIKDELSGYHEYYSEELVYHPLYFIAGMADIICKRTRSKSSIFDIGDIKTNADNFTYDSSSVDQYSGKRKQNNRFYNEPIQHLEQTYYNQTALQLSTYAYCLDYHGYRIGNLFVILLPWRKDQKPQKVYMPYMKYEIEAMLNHNPNVK